LIQKLQDYTQVGIKKL